MINSYERTLKTTPATVVKISRAHGIVYFRANINKQKIRKSVAAEEFVEAIELLTLEVQSILDGAKNEDRNSSNDTKVDKGRNSKNDSQRKATVTEGEGNSPSVHSGTGGNVKAKSSWGKSADAEVAESSDTEDSGSDKGGD